MALRRYLWPLAGFMAGCGSLIGLFGVTLEVQAPPGVDQVAWTQKSGAAVVAQGQVPVQGGMASWTLPTYSGNVTLEVLGQAGDFPLYLRTVPLSSDQSGRKVLIDLRPQDRGQAQMVLQPKDGRSGKVYVYVPASLGGSPLAGPPLQGYALVGAATLPQGALPPLPLAPEYRVGVDLGNGLCFPGDPLKPTAQQARVALQSAVPLSLLAPLDYSRCP